MCLCQNHHPGKSGTVETQLTTSEMKRTPPEVCKTPNIIEFGPIAKDIGEVVIGQKSQDPSSRSENHHPDW